MVHYPCWWCITYQAQATTPLLNRSHRSNYIWPSTSWKVTSFFHWALLAKIIDLLFVIGVDESRHLRLWHLWAKLHKMSITGCLFAECGGPGRSFEGHAQCVELKLHCWLPFTQFLCSEAVQESMTRWAQHFLIHRSRPKTIIFYLKRGCCYVIFQQLQQNSAQSSFFHMLLFQYILPFLSFWFVIN